MKLTFASLLSVVVAGCGQLDDGANVCAHQARERGSNISVAAAFQTTPERVRGILAFARDQVATSDETVVLCYLDGNVPKAPPEGRPFDREVVVVIGGTGVPLRAGYQEDIDILDPNQ